MSTNVRYSALDHGGLEATEIPDSPEPVPRSYPPLARRSLLNELEPLHPRQYEINNREYGNYYAGEEQRHGPNSELYSDDPRLSYVSQYEKNSNVEVQQKNDSGKSRRYYAMRLPIFIGLIVGSVIVVIAVVLGGVLGSVLTRHHSSPNPTAPGPTNGSSSSTDTPPTGSLQVGANTGLAATKFADGSGRLITYYQDLDGRVIENSYLQGSGWTLENHDNINSSIVTTAATARSPLAAVSYVFNNDTYRHVFFVDGAGNLKETKTSTYNGSIATGWSTPNTISDAVFSSHTVGLAACVDHNLLNGIHVYYGSSNGREIEEYSWQFNDTSRGWQYLAAFEESDPNSGVSCTIYDGPEGGYYVNVYLRHATTGEVRQFSYEPPSYYGIGDDGFPYLRGPALTNQTAVSGSDITVCNDNQQSEYIMFQADSGMIVRALLEPSGGYQGFTNLQPGANATKLAASYVDDGVLLMFQNSSSSSALWATDVSRFGGTIMDIAIP